jgi:hypothetical protein
VKQQHKTGEISKLAVPTQITAANGPHPFKDLRNDCRTQTIAGMIGCEDFSIALSTYGPDETIESR